MLVEWDRYQVRIRSGGRYSWPAGVLIDPARFRYWDLSDLDLIFLWKGNCRFQIRGKWVPVSPGTCVWLRPGWLYDCEQDPDDPVGMMYIHFDLVTRAGKLRPNNSPLPPEIIPAPDPPMIDSALRRIIELAFGFLTPVAYAVQKNPTAVAVANTLLQGVLMELDAAGDAPRPFGEARITPRQRDAVHAASLRISAYPNETYFLHELAREAGLSETHFSRVFRAATGLSVQRYVIQTRMRQAEALLVGTGLPVKQIAEQLGYRDIYFFSRQFKQWHALSPLAYRRRAAAARQTPGAKERGLRM